MSDDIVTRLRETWNKDPWSTGLLTEAADEIEARDAEIERLRTELVNVRDLLDHTYQELRKYYDADEAVHDGFGVTVNVVPGKNWNPEQIAEIVKEALKDE